MDENKIKYMIDEYLDSEEEGGIFRGMDGIENLKGENMNLVEIGREVIKQTVDRFLRHDKDFLSKHYLKNMKTTPMNQSYKTDQSLGRFYKRLPNHGVILLRNPGMPSPDVFTLELVILEKFSGNKAASWKLLLQDKILLNHIKFGEKKSFLYETEGQQIMNVNVGLYLGDKKSQKIIQNTFEKFQGSTNINSSRNIESGAQGIGSGGSEVNRGRFQNNLIHNMREEQANPDHQKIKIEMTGGNDVGKGLSRMGTLDKKAGTQMIPKNNSHIEQSKIIDLANSSFESRSEKSNSSAELDRILDDLDKQLETQGRPSFNFHRFALESDLQSRRVLTNDQKKELMLMITKRLANRLLDNSRNQKQLRILHRSGQKMLEQNMISYSYLLGVFDHKDDSIYFRPGKGRGRPTPRVSKFLQERGVLSFKRSGIELTRRTWEKLVEIELGEEVLGFNMDYFVFGNNFNDKIAKRNFMKQQYYPLEQYVSVNKFAKSDDVFGKINNIFILQILQLGSRNKNNFLEFIFDFLHWLNLTYPGQGHFITKNYLVELFFCLFYFNRIPVTREFLDLNLSSLLGLHSEEARDIYEYYRYIHPIKSCTQPSQQVKMLKRWILLKEKLLQDPEFKTGKQICNFKISTKQISTKPALTQSIQI